MVFDELVGKIVKSVWINDDKTSLVFVCRDGDKIGVTAVGDCCSNSWFEQFVGLERLIGQPVVAVQEKSMADLPEPFQDGGDEIKVYGFSIATLEGYVDIEMRNASNGYYGGSVEKFTPRKAGLHKLRGDFF